MATESMPSQPEDSVNIQLLEARNKILEAKINYEKLKNTQLHQKYLKVLSKIRQKSQETFTISQAFKKQQDDIVARLEDIARLEQQVEMQTATIATLKEDAEDYMAMVAELQYQLQGAALQCKTDDLDSVV